MMTPTELKDYAFAKSFKGYNATEVDAFLDQVIENYGTLYSENALLSKKIDLLVEQVEKYREEEDTLRCAIINAQRMGDSIVKDAQGRADLLLRDARIKSDKIVETCRHSVEEQKTEYDRLRHEISDFREKILATYHQHLDIIKELPACEEEAQSEVDAVLADEEEKMDPAVAAKLAEAVAAAEAERAAEKAAETAAKPETVPTEPDEDDTREFMPKDLEKTEENPYHLDEIDSEEKKPIHSLSGELLFGEDYDLEEDFEKPKKKGFFRKKD